MFMGFRDNINPSTVTENVRHICVVTESKQIIVD